MTPAVSVIVPIFNAEGRLERCLQSIVDQTFSDLEILCVDDCSTDRSAEIVMSFQAHDPRIKLIRHSVNLGAGGARNTGIRNASAPYLAFVDADDYALPIMIERLYGAAIDGDHDIVACGFSECDEDGATLATDAPGDRVIDMRREQRDIFALTNPPVWNKLWRTSLFTSNAIVFPEHVYYQDLATTPRLLFKASTVRFINDECYRYFHNNGTATTTHSGKHIIDYFTVFDDLKRFCVEEGVFDRYAEDFARAVKANIRYHASKVQRFHTDRESARRYLRHLLLLRDAYLTGNEPSISLDMDGLISLFSTDPVDPSTIAAEQASRVASLDVEIRSLTASNASLGAEVAARIAEITVVEERLRSESSALEELRSLHTSWLRFVPLALLGRLASFHCALGRLTRSAPALERGVRMRRLRKQLKRQGDVATR